MNILYGLYKPDSGEILVSGKSVSFSSAKDAIEAGLGMVHQHFMLIPVMTVAENIVLASEPTEAGVLLDYDVARQQVRDLALQFGFVIDPDARIEDISVGQQQRVEILKALYRRADILILDEPTAVLTPQETEELFKVMRGLSRDFGTSIIFITHKLKEVLAVADRITVLRRGRVVGSATPSGSTASELASMMVGREVDLEVDKDPAHPGDAVLQIEDLEVRDDHGQPAVNGVSMEVRAGEIVCIAGVQGNGQTELVESIMSLRPTAGGSIRILGKDITHASPQDVLRAGVGHVPEDRQQDGLVLDFSIDDNFVLNTFDQPPYAKWIVRDEAAVHKVASAAAEAFDVRTSSVRMPAGTLSGGNQQKVIVAREFSRPIRLLVASQPTRGLDVGSIEYIHRQIVAKRDEGVAVLIISVELDEVMALADRIAVMFRGRFVDVLPAGSVTRERLGLLMAGSTEAASAARG
jgi:simple sugar transport system ATP-binding protein